MWFIACVEVEQATSAPPPKKILDPPLSRVWFDEIQFAFRSSMLRLPTEDRVLQAVIAGSKIGKNTPHFGLKINWKKVQIFFRLIPLLCFPILLLFVIIFLHFFHVRTCVLRLRAVSFLLDCREKRAGHENDHAADWRRETAFLLVSRVRCSTLTHACTPLTKPRKGDCSQSNAYWRTVSYDSKHFRYLASSSII